MTDDLQQRLDQGMYGTPKVNPEEQRRYLGTFRERCYLKMSITQMKDPKLNKLFQDHLTDFPSATCLLNGVLNESLQAEYIRLLAKSQIEFTIVSGDSLAKEDTIGLLLVAKDAVDESIIDIAEKYSHLSAPSPTKEKPSFFKKIFG